SAYSASRLVHDFPTRRSSDLLKFVLGLTGGIGSGKSAASHWFEAQGITVVDADVVAREVVELGQPALTQIQQAFGDWVLLADGRSEEHTSELQSRENLVCRLL